MNAGCGRALLAKLGIGIPYGIKQDEDWLDAMFLADVQERVDALLKAFGILLPQQIVKKNAHGIEADGFGPAEFGIDAFGIEAIGLPHFQLIDRGRGDVVAADEPG